MWVKPRASSNSIQVWSGFYWVWALRFGPGETASNTNWLLQCKILLARSISLVVAATKGPIDASVERFSFLEMLILTFEANIVASCNCTIFRFFTQYDSFYSLYLSGSLTFLQSLSVWPLGLYLLGLNRINIGFGTPLLHLYTITLCKKI